MHVERDLRRFRPLLQQGLPLRLHAPNQGCRELPNAHSRQSARGETWRRRIAAAPGASTQDQDNGGERNPHLLIFSRGTDQTQAQRTGRSSGEPPKAREAEGLAGETFGRAEET